MNLDKTLPYLDRFMEPGDYLLVEDTHPSANNRVDQGMFCPLMLLKWETLTFFSKGSPTNLLNCKCVFL